LSLVLGFEPKVNNELILKIIFDRDLLISLDFNFTLQKS
jgi:hypothetical protein